MGSSELGVVLDQSRSQGNARLILLAMADAGCYAGEMLVSWPWVKSMKTFANINNDELNEALEELERLGELDIDVEGQRAWIILPGFYDKPAKVELPDPPPKLFPSGYVYLIKADTETTPYKIGMSEEAGSRLKAFEFIMPFDFEVLNVFPCDNPFKAERFLHDTFASRRGRGEWFDLPEEDVVYIQDISAFKGGHLEFCSFESAEIYKKQARFLSEMRGNE